MTSKVGFVTDGLFIFSWTQEHQSVGNADGLSCLPIRPDLCFDGQNHGNINVIESVQEEKLDNLPVKASDIAVQTSKNPVLKHFVWKDGQSNPPNKPLEMN